MSRSHHHLRLVLSGAIVGALGLLLAVALAPTIPAPMPDGTRIAAAQQDPSLNASCMGLVSSLLAHAQLRDEGSELAREIAQRFGIQHIEVFAFVAQQPIQSMECLLILLIIEFELPLP